MLPSDAAGGLTVPPGDPQSLRSAAGRLAQVGAEMDQAHGQLTDGVDRALSCWSSPAADAFGGVSRGVATACAGIGAVHDAAARALARYAEALEHAQQQVRQAIAALAEAESRLSRGLQTAGRALDAASASVASDAAEQLRAAQADSRRAQADFADARTGALRLAELATGDLEQAAREATGRIERLGEQLHDLTLHDVVDLLGAPNTMIELQTVGLITAGTAKGVKVFRALRGGDFAELERASAAGFGRVEAAVAAYGEDSLQALRAWYTWQGDTLPVAMKDVGHAIDAMGEVPRGAAGILDVIGKVGLPLAALGDVLTIADGESSALDRGLSVANLGGIGAAALGTETAGTMAAIIGINAAADWVPVVGEVVIGVTAAYLAGEWAYAHRQEIVDAAKTVGRDISGAVTWVNEQELALAHQGAQLATAAVAEVIAVDTAAVHAGVAVVEGAVAVAAHVEATVARSAARAADDVKEVVGGALSHLNPFG